MSTQKAEAAKSMYFNLVITPAVSLEVGGLTVLLGPARHSHTIDKVASAENNSQRCQANTPTHSDS